MDEGGGRGRGRAREEGQIKRDSTKHTEVNGLHLGSFIYLLTDGGGGEYIRGLPRETTAQNTYGCPSLFGVSARLSVYVL